MYFYKHMSGFYMHSVCFSEELTTSLAHLIGQLINLRLPNGDSWKVGLTSYGSKLAFQTGWCDFARDNRISQTDLLVFKFQGGSEFKVRIFDSCGCEKSFLVNDDLEKPSHDDDDVDTNSESPIHHDSVSPIHHSLEKNGEEEEEEGEGEPDTYKKFVGKRPRYGMAPICNDFYSPQGLLLTEEQTRKAKELTKEIKKGNPTFLQLLKPAHLTSRFSLSVPRQFGRDHLLDSSSDIFLRRPNGKKIWVAKCNYNPKHHEIRWVEFVRENNLLEDDICLFELDKCAKSVTFIVHVARIEST